MVSGAHIQRAPAARLMVADAFRASSVHFSLLIQDPSLNTLLQMVPFFVCTQAWRSRILCMRPNIRLPYQKLELSTLSDALRGEARLKRGERVIDD